MIDHQEKQAFTAFHQGKYLQAVELYQELITNEPEVKEYHWYLGLALLLQGEEADAQTAWMLAIFEGEEAEIEEWTQELVKVLATEAQHQEKLQQYQLAWLIRQHIREINPGDINNLFQIIQLSLHLGNLTSEDFQQLGIIEFIGADLELEIDKELLFSVLKNALKSVPFEPWVLEFAEACIPYLDPLQLTHTLMLTATEVAYAGHRFNLAIKYAELCLKINYPYPAVISEVLSHLASFYYEICDFNQGIEIAKQIYDLAQNTTDLINANFVVLEGLLRSGGRWQEAIPIIRQYENCLNQLITEQPNIDRTKIYRLINSTYFLPYIRDAARQNRSLHNQILKLCQANIEVSAQAQSKRYSQANAQRIRKPKKQLKIGYLSHCFREHSVGWLARWLYQHHDREQFEIYTYFVNHLSHIDDFLQNWYEDNSDHVRKLGRDGIEIAEQIHQDKIDILIDLDSMTADISCEAIALKPAPIQVTWLGWDGSGIPAIDYYIADNYVLPEYAQEYYSEKIWRLPNAYLGVDGFEIGVPTLRREDLEIPNDAVIYFSAQSGYKRNPDNVRLQMKILKQVPNSYFLIKDINKDVRVIREFFEQIAEEEGVSKERLRFLEKVPLSSVHRANLMIADVVLDTYPYNGATTTMETLWVGVPLVTKVGEQFSARNSYTMMVNAGISEGIAWNDEEYIEWGVRLGKDADMRKEIHWKLLKSRQTAPLWNGKQFTRDMEKAYQQMWDRFI
ncbi:O-linked N-acetylglucosamine transferase, SPINDLY family protein [Anabaena catenula]|uniref:O-linked N-acetylglucosamine transferase, SPINDLY family protein n=1 Tax=Anabaena catenula FACHB-362 TaxID=2692877 RepID=A0ABR8J0F7_9NOST|nr:O-linked N-acetylglucosamine transferase, SPINDLY family protein [Anabaena catenula]MBD2691083.1 O-linked N-acetylglucosamine transferase, SPINDLY family protein [Anabaena catenula FACHB-362]